jgi:hypothetical protein
LRITLFSLGLFFFDRNLPSAVVMMLWMLLLRRILATSRELVGVRNRFELGFLGRLLRAKGMKIE